MIGEDTLARTSGLAVGHLLTSTRADSLIRLVMSRTITVEARSGSRYPGKHLYILNTLFVLTVRQSLQPEAPRGGLRPPPASESSVCLPRHLENCDIRPLSTTTRTPQQDPTLIHSASFRHTQAIRHTRYADFHVQSGFVQYYSRDTRRSRVRPACVAQRVRESQSCACRPPELSGGWRCVSEARRAPCFCSSLRVSAALSPASARASRALSFSCYDCSAGPGVA